MINLPFQGQSEVCNGGRCWAYVVSMILACMFLDIAIDMKKMFTQCIHYM